MMRALLTAAALAVVAACQPGAVVQDTVGQRSAANFPAGWRFPAGSQRAASAPSAMVASESPSATDAGVEILRRGGNAVDAAVAVGFALAVTDPEAGNIGGGGYMVIRKADGTVAALDYREIAPLAATRNMYVDANGKLTDASVVGHLASGVPGAVAGMTEALRAHGTMSLADVMAPAIRLAKDGFVVDSALSESLTDAQGLIGRFAGRDVWLPGGAVPKPGVRITQPALARTLELIATRGAAGFYTGAVADSFVAEMKRGGGIITHEDLSRYKAVWRTPLRTTYRGHTLLTMPPSSSGGITITETLNILETYADIPAFGSADWLHRVGGAYQLAFIDRNSKLADPDFVAVPIGELTSKEYAATLKAKISPTRATPTRVLTGGGTGSGEGTETTHYSVVDRFGNAVATTTTINELYGSGVFVPGAGFFLNDEMDDFAAQPGTPNMYGLVQGEQNAIAPGKRMLSAMSPTIVLDRNGEVLLVLGARGGPRIITSTSQVILNVIDHSMTLADAMSAPRFHHQALPDTLRHEMGGVDPATRASLERMGHAVGTYGGPGLVVAIRRVGNRWEGMVDPRSSGKAVGY